MLPPNTLELVGTRPADVANFVREHTRWIERARREIAEYSPDGATLPERVELAAVGQSWPVRYAHEPAARPSCRVAAGALLVRTPDVERREAADSLRAWLMGHARFHLKPWLLREAGKTDPPRLERYLRRHGPTIPRTTVRYAIERMPEARRKAMLLATRPATPAAMASDVESREKVNHGR